MSPDRVVWCVAGRSHAEVLRALLLILGCAVQCDRKEEFIDNIQRLDVHVQHDIVACIKEVHFNAIVTCHQTPYKTNVVAVLIVPDTPVC